MTQTPGVLQDPDLEVISKQIVGLHTRMSMGVAYLGIMLVLQLLMILVAFLVGNGTIEPSRF